MLVDDFVTNFKEHRKNFFNWSEFIGVGESMSGWYGLGGHGLNHGLPQYIGINWKPQKGSEIKNTACGVKWSYALKSSSSCAVIMPVLCPTFLADACLF